MTDPSKSKSIDRTGLHLLTLKFLAQDIN